MNFFKKCIFASALILPATLPLKTHIETIALKIDNLACRFCSESIAKRLLDLKSIKDVTFNETNKTILMTLNDKNAFNVTILKDIVERNSHFVVKDIKVTATGKIAKKGKFFILDIFNNPKPIFLEEVESVQPVNQKPTAHNKKATSGKEKGIVPLTKKAWGKTSDYVKTFLTPSTTLQQTLTMYHDHDISTRFMGSVHMHADDSLWCSSNAQFKEIKMITTRSI